MMLAMAAPSPVTERRWLILLASVVSFFAIGATFFVVPPLIPELIARFGLSHLQIGLLMGAISVPAVVLAVPVGLAVDRWTPGRVGLACLGLMLIAAVIFASARSFELLFIGRLLFGIGGLFLNLLLARLLTEAFTGRELAFAMGIFMATYPASMISVYSLHPVLLDRLGWRNELLLLAGLVVLAIPLFVIAVGRESRDAPARREIRVSFSVPRSLVLLAIAWMLFFGVHASVLTFAPEWAGGGAAALLTVTLVMWIAMIGSPIVGGLIDRSARPTAWIVAGLAVQAIALAGAAARVPATAAMLGVGLAAALVPTAVYAVAGRLVDPARVGFAFGFITSFSNLGTTLGPTAAGALLDHAASWPLVWATLAAAAAVAAAAAGAIRVR